MKKPTDSWRLIRSGHASGAANMGLDEAILEAVQSDRAPATLRLYGWEPPALSLGYAQSIDDVDFPALKRHGWDLVRRPTGGRAILHTDELTYSVVAPADHPLVQGGVLESYHRISEGLIRGLELLGVVVEVAPEIPGDETAESNPVCFEVPSAYEITAGGRKLVGSAQVRRRGGVLQHGSIPLRGDIGRICLALAFDSTDNRERAAKRVRQRAATLEQLMERRVTWDEAADALIDGFTEALELSIVPAELTRQEIQRADELQAERRVGTEWTTRV
ncbi:MAG: biotin/lipoate A/B protein ligase family protein [Anaerolineales bacterium]|nr:biotin/lipoate A/B protein ligase family protein [Anaerolineales bacterium]